MYFNLMTRRENELDSVYAHFAYIRVPEDCIYYIPSTDELGFIIWNDDMNPIGYAGTLDDINSLMQKSDLAEITKAEILLDIMKSKYEKSTE